MRRGLLCLVCMLIPARAGADWPCDGDDSTWPQRSGDPVREIEVGPTERPTPESDAALVGDALLLEINFALVELGYGHSNPQRARKLLEDALSDGRLERTPKILTLLSRAQQKTGEIDRGIETLVEAARQTRCSRLWMEAAIRYDQMRSPRRAAEFLTSVIASGAFEPDDREWSLLVDLWDAGASPRSAVAVLEQSGLAAKPAPRFRPHGHLFYRAAIQAEGEGDAAEAVRLGLEAVDRGYTHRNVFQVLERAHTALGDGDAARAARARAEP